MKKTKIAINGFGRIGRVFFRQTFDDKEIEVVAVNDLADIENIAYLLKRDSVYGVYDKEISVKGEYIVVDGKEIKYLQEKDPSKLPWGELGVDVVIEATGVFRTQEKASAHIDAGAKRVVITAPAKDEVTPTATPNVGIDNLKKARVTSNASCTTNATTPVMAVMNADPGVEKAMLTTIHGYTATQSIVDAPSKGDFLKGRAAAANIVPHATGAAKATQKAIPEIEGKFDGIAMRVPVITGSVVVLTFLAKRNTTREEVNDIFRKAAADPAWKDILCVSEVPFVSTDVIGDPHGAIVDLTFTRVVDGNLVKVFSWYDNEWGYTAMLVKHVLSLKSFL